MLTSQKLLQKGGSGKKNAVFLLLKWLTAAWLAQLGERRSAEREVAGSNPGRTNT